MSFSFFDEIDSSSSQKNSEIVMNYLITSSIFNQLFFITQKKTTVDYIVYNFPDVALIQAKNGKWGYKNRDGKKTILRPTFELTTSFERRYGSRSIIKYNGKFGLVSSDMEYILFPIYDAVVKEDNEFYKR